MRPMNTSPASLHSSHVASFSPARTSFSRTIRSAVDGDQNVRRLDDRDRCLSFGKLELVDRLVGDRGRDGQAVADIDADMGSGGAFDDIGHFAFELVARADL